MMSEIRDREDNHAVISLAELLSPLKVASESSRGRAVPGSRGRVFGGTMLAQSITHAAREAPEGMDVQSVHIHFLRAGDISDELRYDSLVLHASRSFTTIRVDTQQTGRTLTSAVVSFHAPEFSPRHSRRWSAEWCDPEGAALAAGRLLPEWDAPTRAPFDVRCATASGKTTLKDGRPLAGFWVRAIAPLARERGLHEAALSWVSDFSLTRMADFEYSNSSRAAHIGSLNQALWFHGQIDLNEWHLYEISSPSYSDGVATSSGAFFTRAGKLVASTTQELLIRRPGMTTRQP
jgi:acyl-CoA thioesterase-2